MRYPSGRALGFALMALGLLGWEAASVTRVVNPFYFPPVHEIGRHLAASIADGRVGAAVLATLARGLTGYVIAAVLAVALGALAGRHPFVRQVIDPAVELLRPLPSPAIIPVAILLLGIGGEMKVFIVGWACFFPILLNTIDGVRSVPPALRETARNLGMGYIATMLRVELPAAGPMIFTGLRIALAVMLILAVVTEMVAGNSGIGYLLLESERTFRTADMYGLIAALAVVGYLLNRLFLVADRRILAWHHAMHKLPAP
jgi:ABC-type nitrate/sulfonate/bicarbonate transport system permease component